MPCATTPAPLEEGRPAPKSSRGRTPKDAQQRWLADKRQYAPWHYKREAMLASPSTELCIPPAFIKEQLREIPLDYTCVEGVSDKSRRRLLGNGWQLLAILVLATVSPQAEAQVHPVPLPGRSASASGRPRAGKWQQSAPRPTHDCLETGLERLLCPTPLLLFLLEQLGYRHGGHHVQPYRGLRHGWPHPT